MIDIKSTENKSQINENDDNNKTKEKNIKTYKEKKYLGKRGYIINKSFFQENELQEIRDELNVTPFSNMDYGIPETPFKVYKENSEAFFIASLISALLCPVSCKLYILSLNPISSWKIKQG